MLADGPREGDDVHAARPCLAERRGGRRDRCAARVDVVDEDERPWRGAGGLEDAAHVSAPRRERKPALRAHARASVQQRDDRQLPALAELAGQALGRVVAARQTPILVGGHEGERVRAGAGPPRSRALRRAPPACAGHVPSRPRRAAGCIVVGNGGPRGRERDAPARALAAALDRPGGRRAAALTPRLRRAGSTEPGMPRTARRRAAADEQRRGKTRSSSTEPP